MIFSHLWLPNPVGLKLQEHPEAEQHVHRELCLHNEQVRGGHQLRHQPGRDLPQPGGVVGEVGQEVDGEPVHADRGHLGAAVLAGGLPVAHHGLHVDSLDHDHCIWLVLGERG